MNLYLKLHKNSSRYEEESRKLKRVYEQVKRRWYGQITFEQTQRNKSKGKPMIRLFNEDDFSYRWHWETDVIEIESTILSQTDLKENIQTPATQDSENPPEPGDEDELDQTIKELREKAGIGNKPELEFNEEENEG